MDAVVVSQLLAGGTPPDLFKLRELQYSLMADDFEEIAGRPFPISVFSEDVFNMRREDRMEIPADRFGAELKCMEKHKMVVKRYLPSPEDEAKTRVCWQFRHDKLMEYFVMQAFVGEHVDRQAEFFDDPRFRGVYLLLADQLPMEEANVLEAELSDYAAENQDGTVSFEVRRRLRLRRLRDGEMEAA
jgi:hypothetical protein